VARARCCRGPTGPEEELSQRDSARGIGHHDVLHRVVVAQLCHRRCAAEQIVVVTGNASDGLGAIARDEHDAGCLVEVIRPQLSFESRLQLRLPLREATTLLDRWSVGTYAASVLDVETRLTVELSPQ